MANDPLAAGVVAPPPDPSLVPRNQLLRLQRYTGSGESLLPDISNFLNDLITYNLGLDGGNNYVRTPYDREEKAKNFLLKVSDKRQESTEPTLYLTDVTNLVDGILQILADHYSSNSLVQALFKSPNFKNLPLVDQLLIQVNNPSGTLVSELKAFERRTQLLDQVQELAIVIGALISEHAPQPSDQIQSLRPLVPEEILQAPLTRWSDLVLPLATIYQQTAENATVVTLPQQIHSLTAGNYIGGDFPAVFNYFSRVIAVLAQQTENKKKLPEKTLTTLKSVQTQNFYFSGFDESDNDLSQQRKVPSYAVTIRNFIAFFGQEVIPYLVGEKKLEEAVAEAAAAAAENEGGENEAPPPEPPPSTELDQTQLLTQLKKEVATEVLTQLQITQRVLIVTKELTLLRKVNDQISDEVVSFFNDQDLSQRLESVISQAQAQNLTLVNPATGIFLLNEQTRPLLTTLVQTLTAEFIASNIVSEDYLANLLGELDVEEFIADQEPTTATSTTGPTATSSPSTSPPSPGTAPFYLPPGSDIDAAWWRDSTPEEQVAILKASPEWWQQLSIQRRAQILRDARFPTSFNTLVQGLSFDAIRDYLSQGAFDETTRNYLRTLSPDEIIKSEFYPQIQQEINTFLLTQLSSEELFGLFYSRDRIRYWPQILLRIRQENHLQRNQYFKLFIQQVAAQLDKKIAGESLSFLRDQLQRQQYDQNIDAIFVLVNNPEAFIANFGLAEVEKYFYLKLTTDEELALFKSITLRRIALRRSQYLTAGLLEEADEVDEFLPQMRSLSRTLGPTFVPLFTESYDEGIDPEVFKTLSEEVQQQELKRAAAKRAWMMDMWKGLQRQEQAAIYQQYQMQVAAGAAALTLPPQFRMSDAFEAYAKRPAGGKAKGLSRFLPSFLKPGEKLDPKAQFFKALDKTSINMVALAANGIVPGLGAVIKFADQVGSWLGLDTKKVLAGLGILTAGVIALVAKALTSIGGLIGGLVGGGIGLVTLGPGGMIMGGIGGSLVGYGAGEVFGINSMGWGQVGSKIGSVFSGTGVAQAAPILPAAVPGVTMVGLIVVTNLVQATTSSAFIKPLPTISNNDISLYVIVEKSSINGRKFDTPTDITYSIRIKAKDGYVITLTDTPTDSMQVTVNHTDAPGSHHNTTDPLPPSSPERDSFLSGLTQYKGKTIDSNDYLTLGSYTVPFTGGANYNDANIINKFTIKFTVAATASNPNISLPPSGEEQTATASEVICFGLCPQIAGGCWPVSGVITQLPFGGFSHQNEDAYDISNTIGTPVYAPYKGTVNLKVDATTVTSTPNYGKNVILHATGNDRSFIFAHLYDFAPGLNIGDLVDPSAGKPLIGQLGNTGYTKGPHLHYGIADPAGANGHFDGLSGPSDLVNFIPPVDKNKQLGDPVVSCYDQ